MKKMNWTAIPIFCGAIVGILVVWQITKGIRYEYHYRTVCLDDFSAAANKDSIAQFYINMSAVKIIPQSIEISDLRRRGDGEPWDYRYRTADGKYFGLGVGNFCGVEDVLPDDEDATVIDKFGKT